MHVAVIGAKGMLGRELCRALGAEHQVTAWDIEEIDITHRTSTLQKLTALRPELILNTAAFVDVDRCETEPDQAWRINAVGAQNLALAAQQIGGALLYISTDYVFDGESTEDYDEVAPTRPINHYGRSKLAGEVLSTQICPRTFVVRTAWLIGHHANSYVERVIKSAQRDGVVRMAPDQIESPTYTGHLAEAISHLIETGAYGCYNITNLDACTRVEFAKFVLEYAGRTEPVESADVSTLKRVAKRPRRTVLDCRVYRLVTGESLPHWHDGIKAYFAHSQSAPISANVS
jgi:dTDP-4-dehydrorhamnose reductase